MIEDDHLLADLPLVVLHIVPVEDGHGHDEGGGDGEHGHQHRAHVPGDEAATREEGKYFYLTQLRLRGCIYTVFTHSTVRYDDLQGFASCWPRPQAPHMPPCHTTLRQ